MHLKASATAVKNTHYSDSLSAGFQGNLMHMFITKNSVAAVSGDTSVLIMKAIVGAAGQNQVYDVLRHSMRKYRES